MFPLYDSNPQKTFPFMNYLIIVANILVFFLQISAPSFDRFILQYGFIPQEFNLFHPLSYFFILSSMFMHGGLLHIASNLWFLHIFGDNVEDEFGHFKYLGFYLTAGLIATLAQYVMDTSSAIPLIGASGAISGVTGAYFILFRKARIRSLVTTGFYFRTVDLPASFFLGVWFFIQLLSGFTTYGTAEGGVAWFAHIGGFVFGWIVATLFGRKQAV